VSKTMTLLALANSILCGTPVVKAEGNDDPDALPKGNEEGSATPEQLEAARQEAQSAAPAPGAEGQGGAPGEPGAAPGAPEPDGDEGKPGPGDGDGDEGQPVSKAEIIHSVKFLMDMHEVTLPEVVKAFGVEGEEVLKSFSGLEGDPAKGKAPVGKGIDALEKLVEASDSQGKVLEAIASFLAELSRNQVSLAGEVAKSLTASESAQAEATKVSTALAGIMRTAPAAPAKARTADEIAKAEPSAPAEARPTPDDLFHKALRGELNPLEAARQNHIAHGTVQ